MNPTYTTAVEALSVPILTKFVKDHADDIGGDLAGWAKMLAKDKRAALLEALTAHKEGRKAFVAFYADATDTEADFSEWETGELPGLEGTEPAPAPASDPTPVASTVVATIQTAPVPAFVEGHFDVLMAQAAGLTAQEATAAVAAAEDNLEMEHIRIGVLLAQVHSAQHYETLGYPNMREYIDGETGLHYRKAMTLVQNANRVRELGLKTEQLKGVGWSALRHILPVLTPKNANRWLEKARTLTHVKLIAEVDKQKAKDAGNLPKPGAAEGEVPNVSTMAIRVFGDQKAVITDALKLAKKNSNTDHTGTALEAIAMAYTGAPVSESSLAHILPDLSHEGMVAIMTKLREDLGVTGEDGGAMRVLRAFEEVFPTVALEVDFGAADQAAAQTAE